ncbi:hypothetical protein, partial [Francisella noatunensis]|uniref:hypothetical protein n=1 Tax=Francisella noatunensis TaxID=657445 RepID=UPI001F2C5097
GTLFQLFKTFRIQSSKSLGMGLYFNVKKINILNINRRIRDVDKVYQKYTNIFEYLNQEFKTALCNYIKVINND